MKAIIITIGDELLIGQTIDTNSAWMGAELSKMGFDVCRKVSVHDRRDDIINILKETAGKADVALITGGLGPTSDDITKPVLCEFFDTHLVLSKEVLSMIEEMMKLRGYPMIGNNRKQAEVPESCTVLKNAVGTAPGMWFEKDGTIFISMPGVPPEMKYLMNQHVIPELKKRFRSQVIIHKNIMTYGDMEARLADTLRDFESELPGEIRLAYLPAFGVIKLRLTATGRDRQKLSSLVDSQVRKLYKIIPGLIFAEDEENFENVIGTLLKERKKTMCTAESCTGGRIAQMITSVAGSSGYFRGSVIAYDNSVKRDILGISENTLSEYGAVSREVVEKMASGVRKLMNADFSVATSGIAGPDGGTRDKPVGTVWISVDSDNGTVSEKYAYGSDRNTNITRFSIAALSLLQKEIKGR